MLKPFRASLSNIFGCRSVVDLTYSPYFLLLSSSFFSGVVIPSLQSRVALSGTCVLKCAKRKFCAIHYLQKSHNTPLLPPPPPQKKKKKKICIGIVIDFSWDIFMSQEKLQTMVMQKSWGVIEVYYGIVQVVNYRKKDPT